MKGILVYNKADAEYNRWFIEHIIDEGKKLSMEIRLVLSEDIEFLDSLGCMSDGEKKNLKYTLMEQNSPLIYNDFAIMRNRSYVLSEFLESFPVRCFNNSEVCRLGNNKWEMYRRFSSSGIPVMYTQRSKLPFPFVMKPTDGHGGEHVYYINDANEYEDVVCGLVTERKDELESSNMAVDEFAKGILDGYIYQMAASEKGRDVRVYVIGDMILTAMERKALEGEFRANFSLGGRASEYALTDDELRLVAKTAKVLNADFVGIDLIYNNGKPVVNEIEDAVGTRMLYEYTDIDPVIEYLKWIKKEITSM